MAITYPLAWPTFINVALFDVEPSLNQSLSQSFNRKVTLSQAFGNRWEGKITFATMNETKARQFLAWHGSLRGAVGTFTLPWHKTTIEGSAGDGVGKVKGAAQLGNSMLIDGLPVSTAGHYLAGDVVAIDGMLKRVLVDGDSDVAGEVTLEVTPPFDKSPADNAGVVTVDPSGTFYTTPEVLPAAVTPGKLFQFTMPVFESLV